MSEHIILSLDFGTSFCKCYANDGIKALAEARQPIRVSHPNPEVSEFDPEDPDHYPNYQALFRDADQRMYQKKKAMNGLRSN